VAEVDLGPLLRAEDVVHAGADPELANGVLNLPERPRPTLARQRRPPRALHRNEQIATQSEEELAGNFHIAFDIKLALRAFVAIPNDRRRLDVTAHAGERPDPHAGFDVVPEDLEAHAALSAQTEAREGGDIERALEADRFLHRGIGRVLPLQLDV